jgi:hypothetical protein
MQWKELRIGVKVLLPNDCVGVITEMSPLKTMQGGLVRGRDKVKCRYTTRNTGETEAWFAISSLRKYEIVIKKVPTEVQPPKEGEEPWKTRDTFNGVEIVDPFKTEEVIIPVEDDKVMGSTENIIESGVSEVIPTNVQDYSGTLTEKDVEKLNDIAPRLSPRYEGMGCTSNEEIEKIMEANKEPINELPDLTEEDKAIDDDSTEMGG